jgi:hypothetical protein
VFNFARHVWFPNARDTESFKQRQLSISLAFTSTEQSLGDGSDFLFLIGPFGGYGSHTKPTPGLQSYEIPGSVEGKTASEIRMIVYAAGCEIKPFVLPLSEASRVKQKFECNRASKVLLSGQIVPVELARRVFAVVGGI